MTKTLMVHTWHCRKLGYCRSEVRKFCSAHGVSYNRFLKTGIPIEEVELIEDVFATRLVRLVRGNS